MRYNHKDFDGNLSGMTLSMHGVFLRNVNTSVRLTKKETYDSYVHRQLYIIPQNMPYLILTLSWFYFCAWMEHCDQTQPYQKLCL